MTGFWLAWALLLAPPANPGSRLEEALERATGCRPALDLACAEVELSAANALLADGGVPRAMKVRAVAMTAEVALGLRRDSADEALRQLLAFDPARQAPYWAPEWRARLDAVRRTLLDRLTPTLQLVPLGAVRRGQSVTVEVRATDPSGVAQVTIHLAPKPGENGTAIRLIFVDGRLYRAALPDGATEATELVFWVEGADQYGTVTRLGGPGTAALTIPILPPEPAPTDGPTAGETPYYETWWFWTATIGGAALLAGAGGSPGRSSTMTATVQRALRASSETCGSAWVGRNSHRSHRLPSVGDS